MSKVTYYRTAADEIANRIKGSGVNRRSVAALAREIEVPVNTVRRWLKIPSSMPLIGAVALMDAIGMSTDEVARELTRRR